MKTKRQFEIEIHQREISLAIRKDPGSAGDGADSTALAEHPASPCPACGALWVLLYDASASVPPVTGESLRALLGSLPLHVHASPAGHLWICRKSFDHLKEQQK